MAPLAFVPTEKISVIDGSRFDNACRPLENENDSSRAVTSVSGMPGASGAASANVPATRMDVSKVPAGRGRSTMSS